MTGKVGLISLGCAKNLVNSEQMLYLLKKAGFEVSGEIDGADAVVVNTCGFIESAKMEAIETIIELGMAKSEGRLNKLIVAGCLAERYKDEIMSEMPEIDAIVGTGSFGEIADAVKAALGGGKHALLGDINADIIETGRILTTPPAWAYLKIAEGCDNRCAFCVIPDIRGRYRSRRMEDVLEEARVLAQKGVKELIVVAQDITRYGLDIYGRRSLSELLVELCKIEDIKWIRPHYLYPDGLDSALIRVIADEHKILKYLDIPIQHINGGILKNMRRRGTEIREMIERLRIGIPGVVIRTSIITGLPGEGENEFEELCAFLRETEIERAGVFPYSPEEGTAAALMDRPDTAEAVRRAELVADIQSLIMDRFNERRIGSVTEVLIEGCDGGGFYGRSYAESPEVDGYIRVAGSGLEIGSFIKVRITGVQNGEPVGERTVSDVENEYRK